MRSILALFLPLLCVPLLAVDLVPFNYALDGVKHDPQRVGRLTYDSLKVLAVRKKIRDLDSLLDAIEREPAYDRPLRAFTLVHDSEGRPHADVTELHPRILFHKDGFFAAVTGDPSRASYQEMEIFEYQAQGARWRRRLIDFSGSVEGKAAFTDAPTQCARCHGDDPRPRWGSYPLWPGALGGYNDALTTSERKLLGDLVERIEIPSMRRYRYFFRKRDEYPADSANVHLGIHLNAMNWHRVASQLLSSAAFPPYRFAIYGALLGCDAQALLPERLAEAHRRRLGMSAAEVRSDTEKRVALDVDTRWRHFASLQPTPPVPDSPITDDGASLPAAAALRFMLEGQRLDPELRPGLWSLSHQGGKASYAFSTGLHGLSDLSVDYVEPAIRREHPQLKRDCAAIAVLSREALRGIGE